MTVVVTGASGHIGGNLVRKLLEEGRDVRAMVHRDTRAIDGIDVKRVSASLQDVDSLVRAFEGAQVVYHLAARIVISAADEDEVHAVNVQGVRNVLDACEQTGVRRLVHFSSIHALAQKPVDRPLDESRALADTGPCLLYDRTKALGQREVLAGVQRGIDAVIINCGAVLGRNDFRPSHQGEMLLGLYHRRIPALVPGGYTWVDVRDVVDGALAVEEKGKTGESYLLTGEWISMLDLSKMVGEVTGAKTPRLVLPMFLARIGAPFVTGYARLRKQRPLFTSESLSVLRGNTRMSHDKAARELGFCPRPLRETIEDAFAWFDQAGELSN